MAVMSSLSRQVADLPSTPGVYAFRDRRGRLLYVGKAVNLQRRVASYLKPDGGHTGYTRRLKRVARSIEHMETGSELEALLVEARVIREDQPTYNVVGRHARHYGFVRLTSERFPKIEAVRDVAEDGGRYYGPFPPELDLEAALAGLQNILKWRRCPQLERRPCLHHEVGACLAPCGMRDPAPYDAMMRTLDQVLAGQGEAVLAALAARRDAAAKALDFERAARLRDRHKALAELITRVPLLTLDAVVVTRRGPGAVRLLALRAGRLVAAQEVGSPGSGTPSPRSGPEAVALTLGFLTQSWSSPPPPAAVTRWDLRVVDIVCGYLYRHREDPDLVAVDPRHLAGAALAIAKRAWGRR